MPADHPLARSFGRDAAAYEAARPEYPEAAVAWALAPLVPLAAARPRVADVGAGTGKLTRALVRHGAEVVAVEPDEEMAAELRAGLPGVETRLGSGESLPLADAGFDAVAYGQAWHWVDGSAATAEAARVLRPGGVLALVWNTGDRRVEPVARIQAIMGAPPSDRYLEAGVVAGPPFGPLEEAAFEWSSPITAEGILDLARSRSTFITASPGEQSRILRELRAMCGDLGLADGGTIEFPHITRVFRAIRA